MSGFANAKTQGPVMKTPALRIGDIWQNPRGLRLQIMSVRKKRGEVLVALEGGGVLTKKIEDFTATCVRLGRTARDADEAVLAVLQILAKNAPKATPRAEIADPRLRLRLLFENLATFHSARCTYQLTNTGRAVLRARVQ